MRGLYKEKQKFSQWWLLGLILVSTLASVGTLAVGMIQQLILGKPWGDQPMSDTGLILVSVMTIAIMGGVLWLIFSMELQIEVHDRAIYYAFLPFIIHLRRIGIEEIESWEVSMYNPIRDFGGYGMRKSFGRKTAFNIRGNKGLMLKLKSGKTLLLGTQKPNELRTAIQNEFDKLNDTDFD